MLLFGTVVGFMLIAIMFSLRFVKKQNNKTQKIDTELQSLLDDMSAREFYIHKMSQTNLIWDPRTQAYIRKWSKNDTTFH